MKLPKTEGSVMWVLLLKDADWARDEWNGMTPACAKLWEQDSTRQNGAQMWTVRPSSMKRWRDKKKACEIARKLHEANPPEGWQRGRRWIKVVKVEDLPAYLVANVLTA